MPALSGSTSRPALNTATASFKRPDLTVLFPVSKICSIASEARRLSVSAARFSSATASIGSPRATARLAASNCRSAALAASWALNLFCNSSSFCNFSARSSFSVNFGTSSAVPSEARSLAHPLLHRRRRTSLSGAFALSTTSMISPICSASGHFGECSSKPTRKIAGCLTTYFGSSFAFTAGGSGIPSCMSKYARYSWSSSIVDSAPTLSAPARGIDCSLP